MVYFVLYCSTRFTCEMSNHRMNCIERTHSNWNLCDVCTSHAFFAFFVVFRQFYLQITFHLLYNWKLSFIAITRWLCKRWKYPLKQNYAERFWVISYTLNLTLTADVRPTSIWLTVENEKSFGSVNRICLSSLVRSVFANRKNRISHTISIKFCKLVNNETQHSKWLWQKFAVLIVSWSRIIPHRLHWMKTWWTNVQTLTITINWRCHHSKM